MSTTTTKRVRSTAYAVGVAKGKRLSKSKAYSVPEVAALCDVSTYAVLRWINLGYVTASKEPVEGTKRHVYSVTGQALADFFATRKEHQKGVAQRRAERQGKAAAREQAKDEPAA